MNDKSFKPIILFALMEILVTGGAGYIGSALVKSLIEKKHNVGVIYNLSKGKKEYLHPKAKF